MAPPPNTTTAASPAVVVVGTTEKQAGGDGRAQHDEEGRDAPAGEAESGYKE